MATHARPQLTVLYGSATGTAQDVAERIAREAKRNRFAVALSAMDDYDRNSLLSASLTVFVCSTTGDGEEPANMRKFWRFLLRKSLPADALAHLEYTVFGLGDSSYAKFNYPARKLHKRLQQLGARPFFSKGEGDDQHYLGVDGTLDPWLSGLWQVLLQRFPIPEGLAPIPSDVLLPSRFKLVPYAGPAISDATIQRPGYIPAILMQNTRVTALDHFQDTRLLSFTLPTGTEYAPGDIVCLVPENSPDEVESLLELAGWTKGADDLVTVESNDPDFSVPSFVPRPTTLRQILTTLVSPWSPPRRYLFELLSHFCSDEMQREKLREFGCSPAQDELVAYCHRPRRHSIEVWRDFFAVQHVPRDYVFDAFPWMHPREYSAASHAAGSVDVLAAMVEYTTTLKAPRVGVCSRWLRDLRPGKDIMLSLKPGTFTLPAASVPVICIGPGTGIAPMRALVQRRVVQGGETVVFFGCRSRSKDFYFADAWPDSVTLHVAFSRDQPAKVYVQHLLLQHAAAVWDLLQRGAYVYLSGSSKQMPTDVRDALITIVQDANAWTRTQAEAYITEMRASNRYQEETWD